MSTVFQSTVGAIASVTDIEALKSSQLVAVYNELSGSSVKKFADRKSGLTRTKKAFEVWQNGGEQAPAKEKPKGKGKGKVVEADPDARRYRKDSLRGKIIEMGREPEGVTVRRLKNATGWDDNNLKQALGRIESYNGLTVEVTGEGDSAIVKITGDITARKPFSFAPKGEIREVREGSKRAKVLALLKEGATFEEVQKKIGWPPRTAYEGIRLLHGYCGYGLRQDSEGKIFAFTK